MNQSIDNAAAAAAVSDWLPLWGGTAIIMAALLAALVAFFGHVVARSNAKLQANLARDLATSANQETAANARLQTTLAANLKLADFRQNWINSLRDDMA